jgi:Raf kinase inhibitor-like YbhB/YbcL family protein
MIRRTLLLAAAALVAATAATAAPRLAVFQLTSPAFKPGGAIPVVYTCKGKSRSPALHWTSPPAGTKSLALSVNDPDAPVPGGFQHWLGWGLKPTARTQPPAKPLPIEGANGTGKAGYVGPCPPSGNHHYHFTLYALNAPLMLKAGADRVAFRAAIRGHVLGQATLIGTFAAS